MNPCKSLAVKADKQDYVYSCLTTSTQLFVCIGLFKIENSHQLVCKSELYYMKCSVVNVLQCCAKLIRCGFVSVDAKSGVCACVMQCGVCVSVCLFVTWSRQEE